MKLRMGSWFLAAVLLGSLMPAVLWAGTTDTRPAFCDTEAYRQLVKKPKVDEFSKMVFLMNHYRTAPFTIVYEGSDYKPDFVFPFAQIYLFTHYRQEKAAKWAKKHCYRSLIKQEIIYVRYPDGKYETARELTLRDLAQLERALREDRKKG